jgi:DNA-binding CsgD family transcriptional regulator
MRRRRKYDDILTPREWQVLRLIREGLTNEELAGRLGISFGTAKYHVAQVLSKLGVSSRLEAVRFVENQKPLWMVLPMAILAGLRSLATRANLARPLGRSVAIVAGASIVLVLLVPLGQLNGSHSGEPVSPDPSLEVGLDVAPERPQAAAPPTQTSVPPTPAPTTVEDSDTPCRTPALSLGFWEGGNAAPSGGNPLSFTLTNIGRVACFLLGYPDVRFLDSSGETIPFEYKQSGDQVVTPLAPKKAVLGPGAVAYITLNKYRCDEGVQTTAAVLVLTPPGEAASLELSSPYGFTQYGYCRGTGSPGSVVYVSPVAATFRETKNCHC